MRTLLLALFALLLPAGLYLDLVPSTAPGAGLGAPGAGERWIALALVGAAALGVALAYRVRTGRDGPGIGAAAALATFPALVDAVGDPGNQLRTGLTAGAAAVLLAAAAAVRGRAPGTGRTVFLAAGLAAAAADPLLLPSGLALRGAPALGPAALSSLLAAVLAGEAALEIVRRPGLSRAARLGAVAALLLAVAGAGFLHAHRVASWESPRAFWERAVAEAPSSPAPRGAAAGLAARAEDEEAVRLHLQAFVEAVERGEGRVLTGAEARAVGGVGAASAVGFLLRRRGPDDPILAGKAAEAARQLAPSSGQVRWVLGEAQLGLGDAVEAIRLLEEAVRLDPSDAEAWDALARARLRASRFDEALDAAARAAGMRPGEGRFAVTFAEALLEVGESFRALQVLHEALGGKPRDPRVARAYSDAHLRLARDRVPGQEGWARRLLLAGLEVDPANGEARELLDRLNRQFEEARPEAERLVEPGPDGTVLPDDILLYATWLCRWGDFEKAKPWFDFLLERVGNAAVHFHYAHEFWEGRHTPEGLEQAVRHYRAAIAREERYPEAWSRLWRVLRELGRVDEAARAARRFVELAPDHPDSLRAERFLEALPPTGAGH